METVSSQAIPDDFDAMFEAAVRRGEERRKTAPFAASVEYRPREKEYFIRLASGESFGIPTARIPELDQASPTELADVDLLAQGDGIRWESLDLDISTLTLVNRAFGEMIRRAIGQQAGSSKSRAKGDAARVNGNKGGRPKGAKDSAPRKPKPTRA